MLSSSFEKKDTWDQGKFSFEHKTRNEETVHSDAFSTVYIMVDMAVMIHNDLLTQ